MDLNVRVSISFQQMITGCKKKIAYNRLYNNKKERKEIEIEIPAGIQSGKTFSFEKLGNSGGYLHNQVGRLNVIVVVQLSNQYQVRYPHLVKTIDVTLKQIMLEQEVKVETPYGFKTVKMRNQMNNDTVLRISGEGIKCRQRGFNVTGDLYLKIKINNPKHLNEQQKQKMKQFFDLLDEKNF